MADFTHPLFSWVIGIITIIGILCVMYLAWVLSHRKKSSKDDKVETMGHVWDGNLEEYNNPLPKWWLNMFYITCVWGLGYLIFFPGLGAYEGLLKSSNIEQYNAEIKQADEKYGPIYAKYASQDIASLVNDEQALTIGARLFSTYCTTCHGSDARGARGYPNLRDNDWLYGKDPEQIKTTIMHGRNGVMPAWGEILGYENVFNVAAYVKQLAGREVEPDVAAAGKTIYETNCVACHAADGKGNQQIGAPNLTDDIWLYGGSNQKIHESIEIGRNGNMPPHADFLGEDKVHLLAAYIYGFAINANDSAE